MGKELRSDYDVRLEILGKLGGDTTKEYRSVYEVDLAILDATSGGGGMDEGKVREIVEGYEYENEAGVKEIVEGYEYENEEGVKQIIKDEDLQPKLVSGENIKTVNGEDILGEGDIKIEAGEKNWYGTEEEFNELGEYDYETSYHIDGDISYNELADRPTFKTVNGEEIIGSGDIKIDVPTQTKQLEFELEDGTTETINFYVAQN